MLVVMRLKTLSAPAKAGLVIGGHCVFQPLGAQIALESTT